MRRPISRPRASTVPLFTRNPLVYRSRVNCDGARDVLLQKAWNGERINQAEALELYSLPLEELGALANRRRELAKAKDHDGRGNEIVTCAFQQLRSK